MDALEDRTAQLAPTLAEACQAFGVDTWYWDIWGRRRYASEEALRAILTSLGVDANTEDSLRSAIAAERALEWRRPLPPTLVVCSPDFPMRLPASQAESNTIFTID